MIGAPELLIVLVIVLVLFGGAKLPKLARSLGEAQREFKRGTDEDAPNTPNASDDTTANDPADKA
jgi:sec-independent protein translocase protein TatA